MSRYSLAIHGGAGDYPEGYFTDEIKEVYQRALLACLAPARDILEKGGSALDAVECAVRALEDEELFNAGRGAVLNELGEIECDAAIMDGASLKAGALASVQGVRNPISLARRVMEDGRSVLLAGDGAQTFAIAQGVKMEPDSYFRLETRVKQLEVAKTHHVITLDHTKYGTVGAVACDLSGNLAAATSTGGLTNKMKGRIGDSPIIGAGTYAHNARCAVSCTGTGEVFIRHAVGHEIGSQVFHGGKSLNEATRCVVHDMLPPSGGVGGVIVTGQDGELCLDFNSEVMFRAWCRSGEPSQVAIFR